MKCKKCKRDIPEGSVFCMYCGARLVKQANEISVPEPRQLPSGNWSAQLMINGKRQSVTAKTKKEYFELARKYKRGELEVISSKDNITLESAIDEYIAEKQQKVKEEDRLSPETIRGYKVIKKRFPKLMKMKVYDFTNEVLKREYEAAQNMISEETKKPYSEKTLRNSFGLIRQIIEYKTGKRCTVKFSKYTAKEKDFLEPDEMYKLISAVKGDKAEIPTLLALHSLRRSEIMGLKWRDIDLSNAVIYVHQTRVYNDEYKLVEKGVTKTKGSTRTVPIYNEQLLDALREGKKLANDDEYIVSIAPNTIYRRINAICESEGIKQVGVHGLRHTFATLCAILGVDIEVAMEQGGWTEFKTMQRIYTHVSKLMEQRSSNLLKAAFNGNITYKGGRAKITNGITNAAEESQQNQWVSAS